MSQSQKIRQTASQIRREVLAHEAENVIFSASEIIELTAEHFDLMLLSKSKSEMRNSLAILQSEFILFDKTLPEWFKNYCIAHEIGHFILHQNEISCDATDISEISEDAKTSAQAHVGYGAGERKEREANLFALEFLLPGEKLRELFMVEKMSAEQIAEKVGLPKDYVFSQLITALLTPQIVEKEQITVEQQQFDLDESQRVAAHSDKTPLLISAGPGTGKTQTLVKRVLFLLDEGIQPEKILALTFSNKAAEEMRERIAQIRPDAAKKISMTTFHAFGLEILRRFWKESSLEPHSPLIDPIDALLYLEKNLLKLQLEHYQDLSEPTRYLKSILSAISRAKDELCSPEKYLELAEKMLAEAVDEKAKVQAEKAVETAKIYRFYQDYLEQEKLLDFGELIYRAVKLLQQNETVKSLMRSSYDAVLVDEFQDVNRACGVLLKEITIDGKGLWAVGDLRQSIYRWRGASPTNLRQFSEDFPNAETHSLEINYRSNQTIINTFGEFAKKMQAVSEDFFADWEAHRQTEFSANIEYLIADSIETEAAELAEKVLRNEKTGVEFQEQAVICRTHAQLAKFAEILTAKGVPVFYLGELFEREEISDLLALLDLRDSLNGFSLIRAANFAEYKIPFADVQTILEKSGEEEKDFQAILNEEIALSDAGKTGWNLLKKHLSLLSESKPAYQFLCEYLFCQSDYLQSLLIDTDIQKQQNLLAIYQFLNFAKSNENRFAEFEKPTWSFLRHVRTVARYGEDNLFNQVPQCAENLAAVKLLTIHAAKGLEFKAVYLPYLANTKFPSKAQNQFCPSPNGMLLETRDYHLEEEECLFFVAMSRAKDFLHLSRAKYDRGSGKESLFLEKLGEFLPPPVNVSNLNLTEMDAELQPLEQFNGYHFYHKQIEDYFRCPRVFHYKHVLKLKTSREDGVYLKFHSVVQRTIAELMKTPKDVVNQQLAQEKLKEFWFETDLDEHAYAPIYKAKAEEMLKKMSKRIAEESDSEPIKQTFAVEFENGVVKIQPEFMQIENGLIKIRRSRTKKVPQDKEGKDENAKIVEDEDVLLQTALQNNFAGHEIEMKKFYLNQDEVRQVVPTATLIKNRLEKYNNALFEIKHGVFPAKPKEENTCLNCPYFFICPS